MKSILNYITLGTAAMAICSATSCAKNCDDSYTYQEDKSFLKDHIEVVELRKGDKMVLTSPTFQGRVMTSSAEGEAGKSFGWVNRKLISSGEVLPHINNWGGEDRMWLGPEGGQFSLFFPSTESFDFEFWQVPSIIDSDKWLTLSRSDSKVTFGTTTSFTNASGTKLHCKLERDIELIDDAQIAKIVGAKLPAGSTSVGFQSKSRVTNIGVNEWNKETGAVSIWVLGQFNTSEDNFVIIPTQGKNQIVDDYFGAVPADRLIHEEDCHYFKADGKMRGKIGVLCDSALPMAFALDRVNSVLTVISFSFDESATDYVNSRWALQDEPFNGDVLNAYNDGPLEDGTIMGGFYEIESSSKALFLKSSETFEHTHTTIHIKGDIESLERLLEDIKARLEA